MMFVTKKTKISHFYGGVVVFSLNELLKVHVPRKNLTYFSLTTVQYIAMPYIGQQEHSLT